MDNEGNGILIASTIYLLIKKNAYVSRSLRLQWFLRHLHKKIRISIAGSNDTVNEDIVVWSIIPSDPPKRWRDDHSYEYLVTPSTNVIYVAESYRFVYCLDVSPSVSTVDTQYGEVLIDIIIEALKKSVKSLVKPLPIPGRSLVLNPDIYITVIAHTPFYISPAQQVLVQGWKVTVNNLKEFLKIVKRQLQFIEGAVAEVSASSLEYLDNLKQNDRMEDSLFDDSDEKQCQLSITPGNVAMVSPGSGFLNLLRYGMLALKLLPNANFSNLVVVTDGMIISPDTDTLVTVTNHMRCNDVSCFFLHVGSQFYPHCSLGFVPYTEIMQLISVATYGSYIPFPHHRQSLLSDIYQQGFLMWFLKNRNVILDLSTPHPRDGEWSITNRHFYGNRGPQLLTKKHAENDSPVGLNTILACRIHEGFIINDIQLRDNHIYIGFVLPWVNHIYVEYNVSSVWLGMNHYKPVHYSINIRAPYEFLHDIYCPIKKPVKSSYRQCLLNRFWKTIRTLAQTDVYLSHLESFMNDSASYYLPEGVRGGMPLYHVPSSSRQPVVVSSDQACGQFAQLWKPVCLLDHSLWQKWFHTERIGIIFAHDEPLELFSPTNTLTHKQLECRQSTQAVFNYFKMKTSFTLIENHSYVKFLLPHESGTGKYTFYIARIISKQPYAVIHIAFLYNITGKVRNQVLTQLKKDITDLKISKMQFYNDCEDDLSEGLHRVIYPSDYQTNCITILSKPLEKILVRYERVPSDFRRVVFPDGTQATNNITINMASDNLNSGLITTLSRYLHHRRWIWSATTASSSLPIVALYRVLSTLMKVRLHEGFNFAHCGAGMVNMVLEVPMEDVSNDIFGDASGGENDQQSESGSSDDLYNSEKFQFCTIQYILFPPYIKTSPIERSNDSHSDSENEKEDIESAELVIEVWVEPQQGIIADCPSNRTYMCKLQYDQLPDAICRVDAECISAMFTFEYLQLMCEDCNVSLLSSGLPLFSNSFPTRYWPDIAPFTDQRISVFSFAYSISAILKKCNHEERHFPLLLQDATGKSDEQNKILLESMYSQLSLLHNKEVILSGEDSLCFMQHIELNNRNTTARYPVSLSLFAPRRHSSKSSSELSDSLPSKRDWIRLISWAIESDNVDDLKDYIDIDESEKSISFVKGITESDHKMDFSVISGTSNSGCKINEPIKWKCYLKYISKFNCLVTVVPYSLHAVKKLMNEEDKLLSSTMDQSEAASSPSTYFDLEPLAIDSSNVDLSSSTKDDNFMYSSCSSSKSLVNDIEPIKSEKKSFPSTNSTQIQLSPFRTRAKTWDPVSRILRMDSEDRLRTNSLGAKSSPLSRLLIRSSVKVENKEDFFPNNGSESPSVKYFALDVPVYVFSCSLHDIANQFIFKNDYDHFLQFDEGFKYEGVPCKTVLDLEEQANLTVENQCELVSAAFSKSFVVSLFKCLHLGYDIFTADVEYVVNKCENTIISFDITDYLKVVCEHVKSSTNESDTLINDERSNRQSTNNADLSSSSTSSSCVCGELKFIHRLIKKKFAKILSTDFKAIASKPDYYFCSPSWSKEGRNDSAGLSSPIVTENHLNSSDTSPKINNLAENNDSSANAEPWDLRSGSTHSEDDACTSLISNMDSDSLNELINENLLDDTYPLFLHLTCEVTFKDESHCCSIQSFPTCISELTKGFSKTVENSEENDVKISLNVNCLTLPIVEVVSEQQSVPSEIKKEVSELDETIPTDTEINSPDNLSLKDEKVPKKLAHLPDFQYNALSSCVSQIEWLMRNEVVTFMLDLTPVTVETLQLVCDHVISSPPSCSCSIENVPLTFILNRDLCVTQFLQDVGSLKVQNYCLARDDSFYYVVKDNNQKEENTPTDSDSISAYETTEENSFPSSPVHNIKAKSDAVSTSQKLKIDLNFDNDSMDSAGVVADSTKDSVVSDVVFADGTKGSPDSAGVLEDDAKDSPVSAVVLEGGFKGSPDSAVVLEDGIKDSSVSAGVLEKDSPDSAIVLEDSANDSPDSALVLAYDTEKEDGVDLTMTKTLRWLSERELSRPLLPNFWLIMQVEREHVVIYFHCRYLEINRNEVQEYLLIRESFIVGIRELCKVVNQRMLLQNLHDSRNCDQLLVSENEQMESIQDDESNITFDTVHNLSAGCFACDVVYEAQFLLHPRLKTGPIKTGISRGIQALFGVLNRFAANNVNNLFVYKDSNNNVFYMRLYEFSTMKSQEIDENSIDSSTSVSRSCSFSYMNRNKFEESITLPTVSDFRTRNKSTGDMGESMVLKQYDDIIVLKVHGVCEAGEEIKQDLYEVLQNRLDDAVLDVISVLLSRNPLCKLFPDDVHFIQKPNHNTPTKIKLKVTFDEANNYISQFSFLVRKNILHITSIPKYTSSLQINHFQDYSEPEESPKRIKEADIFIYNQNPSSGRAIACIALIIKNADGEIVNIPVNIGNERLPVNIDHNISLQQIISLTEPVCSDTETLDNEENLDKKVMVEFRVWKQGRINMDLLIQKLNSVIKCSLWELISELKLLVHPLFVSSQDDEEEILNPIYDSMMIPWFTFGSDIGVPAVRMYTIALKTRFNLLDILNELKEVLQSDDVSSFVFHKYTNNDGDETCVPFSWAAQNTMGINDLCVLVGRDLNHWKYCVGDLSMIDENWFTASPSKSLSRNHSMQEDTNNADHQKFLVIIIVRSKITLYAYNWTKEKIDKIIGVIVSLADWITARSNLLAGITEQKMGLFNNQPFQRKSICDKNIHTISQANVENLLSFSSYKMKKVDGPKIYNLFNIYRDVKPVEFVEQEMMEGDCFTETINQLVQLHINEEENQKRQLYRLLQSRICVPNSVIPDQVVESFVSNSRLIHYCLTPLLFLPRWRIESAATRDHSLSLQTQSQLANEISESAVEEQWHLTVCSNFVQEYKQYLQSLGFIPVQIHVTVTKKSSIKSTDRKNLSYMQKSLLGGTLLFEIYLLEPFLHVKLYAIEYSRIKKRAANPLVSQVAMNFLDESERIKLRMHLHSFTYDYHLRCLHQFVTEKYSLLRPRYHITSFLDDFIKYYPKAPNYAQSFVQSDSVQVKRIAINPKELFEYLDRNKDEYKVDAFYITPLINFKQDASSSDNECVLVQKKTTSSLFFKDNSNDVKQADDFDITIIIAHDDKMEENLSTINVYVMLTSTRELYPKQEKEERLGNFRTVSTVGNNSIVDEEHLEEIVSSSPTDTVSQNELQFTDKDDVDKKSVTNIEIKQELVNYLGYYSSHEELMQNIMQQQLDEAIKHAEWMVTVGAFNCQTQMLWNRLLHSSPSPLSHQNLSDLLALAKVTMLNESDEYLDNLFTQPPVTLQNLTKTLTNRYGDNVRIVSSPDGKTQEVIILEPNFLDGFVMISMDYEINKGILNLVYRRHEQDASGAERLHKLLEQIVNLSCLNMWMSVL